MEVILKQDVSGVGYKNDIVKVKAGFGNNYLIPNGFALIANDSNKRLVKENVRQAAHKAAKVKQDAEALAAKDRRAYHRNRNKSRRKWQNLWSDNRPSDC
jgi:large subunit ribosomal protein L9